MASIPYGIGPIQAQGCLTDVLVIADTIPPGEVPGMIERDRDIMGRRPGLFQKLLPVRHDPGSDVVLCGGAYLFDTYENAQAFGNWVAHEFTLDGTPFTQREAFLKVAAKTWRVLAAENFQDLDTRQTVMRIEEWRLRPGAGSGELIARWPAMRELAVARGLSTLWLLHDDARAELSLVSAAPPIGPRSDEHPDVASLDALEGLASIGGAVAELCAAKLFDRTSFVYQIWFPVTGAAGDRAPLWPNSPPLPAPADWRPRVR